ncbi:hypothetical protein OS493_030568 [Desmophyllum pertusum]|uniref:Uncharacterized protein n=1 Tax=Desmophyllum pertusum TaxID=174260 RepID=A0A9X0CEG4_9CNID|nr:hypothetical protein OS493_030568 [Desmophyllum pertusum]
MEFNDPSLFTPTIKSNNNPFEFVEENAVKPGGELAMSGYETDSSDESDCSGIETSSAAGFFPIHPGRK